MDLIEIQHLPVSQGRQSLHGVTDIAIPSISPVLTTRWRAGFKDKFLDPGENRAYLRDIVEYVQGLSGLTTQRAIYYAIRGRHPDWTYKGGPLGEEFYTHLVMWLMEKLQLGTGVTMQSLGIWAAPRGYITGDGTIQTAQRGRAPLNAKPALGFDMADVGMILATNAKKVIHFEKDAGLDSLTSGSFPRYIEAIFSTSQGQLTEAANKFLRECEDRGLGLFSVHDGDPSGIQMQLLYGMATKNNCYMPSEFYPTLVRPLGFYPSIGEALGLPPEDVTDKEDKIFDNLLDLLEGKQRTFPELSRYGLAKEVGVIIQERKKWEFQALNAIHEAAPKVYLLEGLRVHNDSIKHVPEAASVKASLLAGARSASVQKADSEIEALARKLVASAVPEVVEALRAVLEGELRRYELEVAAALQRLAEVDADAYREMVKRELLKHPEKYAVNVIRELGSSLISADFSPHASLAYQFEVRDVSSDVAVGIRPPAVQPSITKTTLVDAIEREIIPNAKVRSRVVALIRGALERRFGKPSETW